MSSILNLKKDEENYTELDKWLNIIEHPRKYNEFVDKFCKKITHSIVYAVKYKNLVKQ